MKDGGPAFPTDAYLDHDVWGSKNVLYGRRGMSLRDWFAGMALQGLIASNDEDAGDRIDDLPGYAYDIADALLGEREGGGK